MLSMFINSCHNVWWSYIFWQRLYKQTLKGPKPPRLRELIWPLLTNFSSNFQAHCSPFLNHQNLRGLCCVSLVLPLEMQATRIRNRWFIRTSIWRKQFVAHAVSTCEDTSKVDKSWQKPGFKVLFEEWKCAVEAILQSIVQKQRAMLMEEFFSVERQLFGKQNLNFNVNIENALCVHGTGKWQRNRVGRKLCSGWLRRQIFLFAIRISTDFQQKLDSSTAKKNIFYILFGFHRTT